MGDVPNQPGMSELRAGYNSILAANSSSIEKNPMCIRH